MLMQNFGMTNKEYYGMLWYFLEWSVGRALHRYRRGQAFESKPEFFQAFVYYNCDDVLSCNSKFNIKYIKVKKCFVFIANV